MNIPRVPQLPQQFICEAPAFVLNYIQDVMAWGNMGWDKAQEKETRVAELEAEAKALKPYRYLQPGTPEDLNRYREAIECALGNLSPTFESDPPSVKDATEILRQAIREAE